MPDHTSLGVHVEEVAYGIHLVAGVATSTAVIVGATAKGPWDEARVVTSFGEYQRLFGARVEDDDAMGWAAWAFFEQGGQRLAVLRIGERSWWSRAWRAFGRFFRFAPRAEAELPSLEHYRAAFEAGLPGAEEASILLLPGQRALADGRTNEVLAAAVAHCEASSARVLIFDLPGGRAFASAADLAALSLPDSSFAVTYHPWLVVSDPLPSLDGAPAGSGTRRLPPSAALAGIWARTDQARGVWKAPAGTSAQLRGASDLEFALDMHSAGELNQAGVNPLMDLPGIGRVVWGTRTRAASSGTEWKYVNVRRLAIFLERSIQQGSQWAVFEPNDEPLWTKLRQQIEHFLNGVWRAGGLQGAKPEEAYFARCGRGHTMAQADVDAGRLIIEVGFAPLKPAEFIILHVQHQIADPD